MRYPDLRIFFLNAPKKPGIPAGMSAGSYLYPDSLKILHPIDHHVGRKRAAAGALLRERDSKGSPSGRRSPQQQRIFLYRFLLYDSNFYRRTHPPSIQNSCPRMEMTTATTSSATPTSGPAASSQGFYISSANAQSNTPRPFHT